MPESEDDDTKKNTPGNIRGRNAEDVQDPE